ncbi:MAG: hypothetical protein FWG82_03935 [Oscillospiraceae bacterium]|nr:hypothetical protein [Oscillospiraceae bacterium]
MRKIKIITALFMSFVLIFCMSLFSSAAPYANNGRAYGIARNSGTSLDGNFFYVQIKAMDSKWSSSNNMRFILHTNWIALSSSGESWIESGIMHGAFLNSGGSVSFWNGSYSARGTSTSYSEYKITGYSSSVGAWHTYQISRISSTPENGSYKWGVYVDYTLVKTYNSTIQYGRKPDCGLESNDTVATSAQWNERSIQRISNWNWTNWSRSQTSLSNPSNRASVAFSDSTTGNSILTSK